MDDSYDNALAESADVAYKMEPIRRFKLFDNMHVLERATFQWVSWWNDRRLHWHLGHHTSAEVKALYQRHQATSVAQ
ncbi:IS3 family transposase [Bifidobacterium mongoliense]|uniref:IS3 family transposase n=1 Tax=Bifidobacterium mongoliense TaxID=518643 RepID=UPI003BEF417A